MNQRICGAIATGALVCLLWFAGLHGLTTERPYEEALIRVALMDGAKAFPPPDKIWCEHPPIAFIIFRLGKTVVGDNLTCLRLLCGGLFVAAFVAALMFAIRIPPTSVPADLRARDPLVCLRVLCMFSAFVSPLMVVGGTRLGADGPTYLVLMLTLFAGSAFLRSYSYLTMAAFFGASLGLIYVHAYGLAIAVGLVVGLTTEAIFTTGFSHLRIIFLGGTIIASILWLDFAAVSTRFTLLKDHYWSIDTMIGNPPVPVAGLWPAVTELAAESDALPAYLQIVSLIALVFLGLRGRDAAARFAALGCIGSLACLTFASAGASSRLVVPHWLGPIWLLGCCAFARGASKGGLIATGVSAALVVALPGLVSCLLSSGDASGLIKQAAGSVSDFGVGADAIVFGGTRAYDLFVPEMGSMDVGRSFVFLRGGAFPDSFPGQKLIPPGHLLTAADWARIDARRVVLIQLEAAQKVEIPTDDWLVERRVQFVYPAFTIGAIRVELVRRKDAQEN